MPKEGLPQFKARQAGGANRMVGCHNFGLGGRMADTCLPFACRRQWEERVRRPHTDEDTRGAPAGGFIASEIGIAVFHELPF